MNYHLLWVGSTQTAARSWSPASVVTMSPHCRHSSPGQAAWLGLVRAVSQLASRAPHSSVSSPSPSPGVSLLLLSNISQLNAIVMLKQSSRSRASVKWLLMTDITITPVFTWAWWRSCTRCCHCTALSSRPLLARCHLQARAVASPSWHWTWPHHTSQSSSEAVTELSVTHIQHLSNFQYLSILIHVLVIYTFSTIPSK